MIEIYCDGSYLRKEKLMTSGFVVFQNDICIHQEVDCVRSTSCNNNAELIAFYKCLDYADRIGADPENLKIHTDSNYVFRSYYKIFTHWSKNQWRNSQNKRVKFLYTWKRIYKFSQYKNCLHKIKSHSGIKEHDLADKLCTEINKLNIKLLKKEKYVSQLN